MGGKVSDPKIGVILQNIGDGAAHQVRAAGGLLAKDPWVAEDEIVGAGRREIHQPVPVLRTGESIYVSVKAESFDVWDRAYLELTWWPPPTRKKTKWFFFSRQQRQRFPLSEITTAPSDLAEPKDGEKVF